MRAREALAGQRRLAVAPPRLRTPHCARVGPPCRPQVFFVGSEAAVISRQGAARCWRAGACSACRAECVIAPSPLSTPWHSQQVQLLGPRCAERLRPPLLQFPLL
eukprot:6413787-Alexandrium_andersonii.AAC.1